MNWNELENRIKKECVRQNKSDSYTTKFLTYAKNLFDKGVPIISSPLHFSLLVGMDHQYVCNMANGQASFYRTFRIKKSNGKLRSISEPLPDLKYVQHWILTNILEKISVSPYAKAYVKNQTIKANARFHRHQKVVVTMDIKDFFPSITVFDVFRIFREIGYLENVSWFLANLCCYKKKLPQGAPTSPYLSNLRMQGFDQDMDKYIRTKSIRYTRYADDLTFSGNFDPHLLIRDISKMLYLHGFRINADKTRVARAGARQEVTGIVVNEKLQVPRNTRRDIRKQVYYIKKYGVESHLNYIGETRQHYLEHLLGRINFILFINPKDTEMRGYYDFLKSILLSYKRDI